MNGLCQDQDECNATVECRPGFACLDGTCVPEPGCLDDRDCPLGEACIDGICISKCVEILRDDEV